MLFAIFFFKKWIYFFNLGKNTIRDYSLFDVELSGERINSINSYYQD